MKQKNIVLMVVAVGCGLVAAALTQYSRAKPVEQEEVIVAAKDLPVGTVFTAADMNNLVKRKSVPKDGLPPKYIKNFDELLDKRLGRPMRAEESINPDDLNKGIMLPDGRDLVSLSIGAGSAASGFVPPGSRIDIIASLRLGNTTKVFKLLVNTQIVNANQDLTNNQKTGAYADLNQVGLALNEKEALALELAKSRGCTLTIKLRNDKKSAEDDKDYDIEKVLKLLEDKEHPAEVVAPTTNPEVKKPEPPKTEVKPETPPTMPTMPVVEAPKTVKVWYALKDIAPGTEITADLIKEAFEVGELEEKKAGTALTDFADTTGKVFVLGVAQGHWVTKSMVGKATPKAGPIDSFTPPLPDVKPADPVKPPEVKPEPVKPQPAKPEFVDVPVTGPSGTVVHRYEKFPNGKMRKVAELTPEQAAAADKQNAPEEPKTPQGRKAD